ncbi:MAG: site-specific integrase [Methyloligellaceae bacterium]
MAIRKREWTTSKGERKSAWIVDYRDQHGARRLKTFARKKDAENWRNEAGHEVSQGTHTAASASITVAQAGKLWTDAAEKDGLEKSTVRQYRQHLDLHIVPRLGTVKLSDLTAPMVRDFETWLRDNGRSAAMVRKVISSLGALLADAQESGRVARNVVRERPKKRRTKAIQARQDAHIEEGRDYPTPQEVNAALAKLEGYNRAAFLTVARAGLRSSELRALRWSDIDFKAKRLHVRQRADRWNKLGAPKSAAGRRDIPMTPELVNTLKEWKLECPASKLDLVFPNGAGNVENHGNLYARVFGPAWIAGGAAIDTGKKDDDGKPILRPKYGIHSLRHFFASWLINDPQHGGLGVSPKRAQQVLGHSSLQMTMDTYGHLFPHPGDESEEWGRGEKALAALA